MSINKICTPQWLKDRWLVGIVLTDDEGEDYPDDHYIHALDAAISWAEVTYDVVLRRNRTYTYKGAVDSHNWDVRTWYLNITEHRPLRKILKFSIQYGTFAPVELPASWATITSSIAGQIQLIPGPEKFSSPNIVGGSPIVGFNGLSGRDYVPHWIRVEYEAGFEAIANGTVSAASGQKVVTYSPGVNDDGAIADLQSGDHVYVAGEVHRVADVNSDTEFVVTNNIASTWTNEECTVMAYDPLMLEAIGLRASLPILDTAGDLIIGAGISNQSISIDGLSQSIGSTAGVENSGYGAKVNQHYRRLKAIDNIMRRKYRRINMMMV